MEFLKKNIKWILLYTIFFFAALIWSVILYEEKRGMLTVAFLDVGQGDSIFIEAPNGNQILIDGGPNAKVLRGLSSLMPFYDRSIDVVIATHPDADHINGLIDVFERFDISLFLEPGVLHNTRGHAELQTLIEEEGSEHIFARSGMKIDLGNKIYLEILFPDRDVEEIEINDASIVARLVYDEIEFLFTGDSSKKIERYISSLYGKNIESDVLKVGHHGSKTSTSELLLGFASPSFAIISASKDNSYGHPHDEVLNTLYQFDVDVLSTAEEGTIIFESNGKQLIRW